MNAKVSRIARILLAAALLGGVPALAAAEHGSMSGMDHGSSGSMAGMSHVSKGAGQILIGSDSRDGVRGTAHLDNISKAMAELGRKETHHLMVTFKEDKGGKGIDSGAVAVKVTDPAGAKGEAIKMLAMEGSFGTDLTLSKPGKYLFEIGSKLADGKTRQFRFEYTVK
jgi:type IV secretory pathway TrbL component